MTNKDNKNILLILNKLSTLATFFYYGQDFIQEFGHIISSLKFIKAVDQRCSAKKVFLEISQNSKENTSVRVSFLIKLQAESCNCFKKETRAQLSRHGCISDGSLRRLMQRLRDISKRADLQISETSPGEMY